MAAKRGARVQSVPRARRIDRRGFLATGAAALTAAAAGCGITGTRRKSATTSLSSGEYARLDPRKPENFTNPLTLPSMAGGAMGILDLAAGPIDVTARWHEWNLLKGKYRTDCRRRVQGY